MLKWRTWMQFPSPKDSSEALPGSSVSYPANTTWPPTVEFLPGFEAYASHPLVAASFCSAWQWASHQLSSVSACFLSPWRCNFYQERLQAAVVSLRSVRSFSVLISKPLALCLYSAHSTVFPYFSPQESTNHGHCRAQGRPRHCYRDCRRTFHYSAV